MIRFIALEDSMFQRLTRGHEELHKDVTSELFETVCGRPFEIVRMQYVEGTSRRLHLLRKGA
jgi:hypothetical protein